MIEMTEERWPDPETGPHIIILDALIGPSDPDARTDQCATCDAT